MKWAREIEQYIAREGEKFVAAQARRRPDRNVCCKCAYDLAGVAEPPPTPAAPDLRCPECGSLVSLRDHWRTDGKHSMKRLLTMAVTTCVLLVALAGVAMAFRPDGASGPPRVWWRPIVHSAGFVIIQMALFVGAVVITHFGHKGVALTNHIRPRLKTLLMPFIASTMIIVSGMWLTS